VPLLCRPEPATYEAPRLGYQLQDPILIASIATREQTQITLIATDRVGPLFAPGIFPPPRPIRSLGNRLPLSTRWMRYG